MNSKLLRYLPTFLMALSLSLLPAAGFAQDEAGDREEESESRLGSSSGVGSSGSSSRLDNLFDNDRSTRNRDEDRETSRNDRRSRRTSRDEPESASGAAAGLGADQNSPTGAATRGSQASGRRAAAITGARRESLRSRAPATNVRFAFKVKGEFPVLYFEPTNMQAIAGSDDNEVAVVLHNPRRVNFDSLRLAFEFDPLLIELTKVDLLPIIDNIEGEPDLEFDPRQGLLAMQVDLKKPIALHREAIAYLEFRAVQPITSTEMRVVSYPFLAGEQEQVSGLFLGKSNILGQKRLTRDGTIPLGIEILPDPEAAGDEAASASLAAELAKSSDPILFGRGARGGILVALEPTATQVAVGEEVDVAVRYYNPARSNLDYVHLAIEFDPDALEVVDLDRRNAVVRGVNILEGSKTLFPFDYHVANEADNVRGKIDYRMGSLSEAGWPRRGDLATIRFRAKAAVGPSVISFRMPEDTKKGTAIRFIGQDVVGLPDDPEDGFENTVLNLTN